MGTFAVWELAALLHAETGSPLKVVAPVPRLSRWANNKVAFAETVRRLFGAEFVPRTESAWNMAILAQRVQSLAEEAEAIGLKLPDAAGGDGNVVLQTASLRGRSLAEIQQFLKRAVAVLEWRGERELLVDIWEADVLCSPSVQLWIPPERQGTPVVEGLFVQIMEGKEGMFVGPLPAQFPAALNQEIADRCWLLARLFQRLGYVGRCLFDLILIGDDLQNCRMEFIECNGRWGGTSLPMTLMNRVFSDWMTQPFAVQVFHHIEGLNKVSFAELFDVFQDDLFDVPKGSEYQYQFHDGLPMRVRFFGDANRVPGDWNRVCQSIALVGFISRLKCGAPPFESWQTARRKLDAFLANPCRHEGRENAVVQSAYGHDVGNGD